MVSLCRQKKKIMFLNKSIFVDGWTFAFKYSWQLADGQKKKKILTMGNTAPTFWRHQFCKTRVSHTGIDEDSWLLWYDVLSARKCCSYWCFGESCCLYLLVLSINSQLFLESLDSDPEEGGSHLIQNVTIYQVAWCHTTDDLTVHQFLLIQAY